MIELEEAVKILECNTKYQDRKELKPILEAYDSILANDIYSPIDVPSFPKSAMDGYAIRSKDILPADKNNPVKLKVISKIMAGDFHDIIIEKNQAVKIMTGGKIPDKCDCVVKQEDTDYGEDIVSIFKNTKPFSNYCKIGEDIQKGQLVINKYTKIKSSHIGVLSSIGISNIEILSPMNVSIISTGNEIINPGEELKDSQIYNSCSYIIASKLKSAGINVVSNEICKDNTEKIKFKIQNDKSDIIITIGGVSVGEKDLIPLVFNEMKSDLLFRKINVKPGTPVSAWLYNGKIILSLSGNPFAAMVGFELLFWNIAAKFMRNESYKPEISKAIIKNDILKTNSLRRFLRAYQRNGEVFCSSNKQTSSVLYDMINCNCFIEQPQEKEIHSGECVKIIKFKQL